MPPTNASRLVAARKAAAEKSRADAARRRGANVLPVRAVAELVSANTARRNDLRASVRPARIVEAPRHTTPKRANNANDSNGSAVAFEPCIGSMEELGIGDRGRGQENKPPTRTGIAKPTYQLPTRQTVAGSLMPGPSSRRQSVFMTNRSSVLPQTPTAQQIARVKVVPMPTHMFDDAPAQSTRRFSAFPSITRASVLPQLEETRPFHTSANTRARPAAATSPVIKPRTEAPPQSVGKSVRFVADTNETTGNVDIGLPPKQLRSAMKTRQMSPTIHEEPIVHRFTPDELAQKVAAFSESDLRLFCNTLFEHSSIARTMISFKDKIPPTTAPSTSAVSIDDDSPNTSLYQLVPRPMPAPKNDGRVRKSKRVSRQVFPGRKKRSSIYTFTGGDTLDTSSDMSICGETPARSSILEEEDTATPVIIAGTPAHRNLRRMSLAVDNHESTPTTSNVSLVEENPRRSTRIARRITDVVLTDPQVSPIHT